MNHSRYPIKRALAKRMENPVCLGSLALWSYVGLIQIAFLSVLLREKRRCGAAKERENMPNRSLCVLGSQFNGLARSRAGNRL